MTALFALRGALSGLKTYIVVGLYFACIISEKVLGVDIPGFEAGPDWVQTSINYALVATGRSALKSSPVGDIIERLSRGK